MAIAVSLLRQQQAIGHNMSESIANNIGSDATGNLHLVTDNTQAAARMRIIIIGSGPVGMHCVKELFRQQASADIHVFGNEPYQPYNRVQLSALLAGDVARDNIDIPLPQNNTKTRFTFTICRISAIDTRTRQVTDILGQHHDYDKLIIATGARAFIPNIPGMGQKGVYTFRNLKDTESLYARIASSRHTVIVGGGLLGLEAARALCRSNTQVTLIQQGHHLMNRQLDEQGAAFLQQHIEAMGIAVITNSGVRAVLGDTRVTGVRTRDGEEIHCDTVLLCTGIQPNLELARDAKISVGRGIRVDDQLQTSADNVYAIGECCEHNGQTYGLAGPGLEQAAVLASVICKQQGQYTGSVAISHLKVVGQPVCSMGEVVDLPNRPRQRELIYCRKKQGIYRKLVLLKGRLIGVIGYGNWNEINRLQEAYKSHRFIWPWQLLWFSLTGRLWLKDQALQVSQWPPSATVCQCNSISQGELVDCIACGCNSLAALQKSTGAGTVCGSCKPLLQQLIGTTEPAEKERGAGLLVLLAATASTLVLLSLLLPEAQTANSVQQQGWFEKIWNDKFFKQISGFTLLGLTAIGMLMSLRKRLGFMQKLGAFRHWRFLHITLGTGCAGLLFLHTSFHLGANLNRLLMLDFLGITLLGSVTTALIGLGHKMAPSQAVQQRRFWTWVHLLVSWPLPVLLTVHILTVYYF